MLLSWICSCGGCPQRGSFSFSSRHNAWAFPKSGTTNSTIWLPSWAKSVKLKVRHRVILGLFLFVCFSVGLFFVFFLSPCIAKEAHWFSTGWLQQSLFSSAQSILGRSVKPPGARFKQGRRKKFEEAARPNTSLTVRTGAKKIQGSLISWCHQALVMSPFLWSELRSQYM